MFLTTVSRLDAQSDDLSTTLTTSLPEEFGISVTLVTRHKRPEINQTTIFDWKQILINKV